MILSNFGKQMYFPFKKYLSAFFLRELDRNLFILHIQASSVICFDLWSLSNTELGHLTGLFPLGK